MLPSASRVKAKEQMAVPSDLRSTMEATRPAAS
jgi:hypothetical protein